MSIAVHKAKSLLSQSLASQGETDKRQLSMSICNLMSSRHIRYEDKLAKWVRVDRIVDLSCMQGSLRGKVEAKISVMWGGSNTEIWKKGNSKQKTKRSNIRCLSFLKVIFSFLEVIFFCYAFYHIQDNFVNTKSHGKIIFVAVEMWRRSKGITLEWGGHRNCGTMGTQCPEGGQAPCSIQATLAGLPSERTAQSQKLPHHTSAVTQTHQTAGLRITPDSVLSPDTFVWAGVKPLAPGCQRCVLKQDCGCSTQEILTTGQRTSLFFYTHHCSSPNPHTARTSVLKQWTTGIFICGRDWLYSYSILIINKKPCYSK